MAHAVLHVRFYYSDCKAFRTCLFIFRLHYFVLPLELYTNANLSIRPNFDQDFRLSVRVRWRVWDAVSLFHLTLTIGNSDSK